MENFGFYKYIQNCLYLSDTLHILELHMTCI